jgi:serine protease AprX
MQNETAIECPLCGDAVNKLLYRFHIENETLVLNRIKEQNPEWSEHDGICSRCVDYYYTEIVMQQRMLPEIGPYFPVKSPDDFIILPTPLRLDADAKYTGKGVTICFIDSGFYPHDDLIKPVSRIKTIIDITDPSRNITDFFQPHSSSWHGTMTSVVCAGNGYCSNGLYKGIAQEAELVLIKVQNHENKITTENITKALQWVLNHHLEYDIKIVNMSLGGDEPESYLHSPIDRLVKNLFEAGVAVVAAAGNDENALIKPPANAPEAISVGGVDDGNYLQVDLKPYHSSYGQTIDGLYKPELVANAIWIAAPVLPGTQEKAEAEFLNEAFAMPDEQLLGNRFSVQNYFSEKFGNAPANDVTFLRQLLSEKIQQTKFFSKNYMHVDGTSFAAPIVCSVIAQLLQACPSLTPAMIRKILYSTAKRLPHMPVEKQGYGYIRARHALLQVLKKEVIMKPQDSPVVHKKKQSIEFFITNECAHQISLAGSFNHWAQDVLLMQPGKNGTWKIEIPMLPKGTYKYKFFIDDRMWVEDIDNPVREPDGFNGWNSVLTV